MTPRETEPEGEHPTDADALASPAYPRLAGDDDASPASRPDVDLVAEAQGVVGARYRIQAVAGAGGMGRVFNATDEILGRRVAIKLLRADPARTGGDPAVRQRLVAEARAMAGLNHPNVCRVFEVSLDGPRPFIVMEWIEGIDLRVAWRASPLDERLRLLSKVVHAVAALHAAGLVHRDLKPGNILIDRRGEPVIVDFGLARSSLGARPGELAEGGTPGYAAPEQFRSGAATTAAADVYALGVLLFEMLTDQLPYTGATPSEIAERAGTQPPPLPETLAPNSPAPLQRICLAALEQDPALRYPTAQAMARDLDRYVMGETVAARPRLLTDRFAEQIDEQLARADEWLRQGLVTKPEADRLVQHLCALQRPESPWIIDSRRLTIPQVALAIGGWLVLLSLAVGTWRTWDALGSGLRAVMPAGVTALVIGVGVWLHGTGQRRVSLGYLVTGCLSLPVAVWLLLRETGGLTGPEGLGMGALELARVFGGDGVPGLFNRQLLATAGASLVTALVFRLATGSGAFTLFSVMSLVAAWGLSWVALGRLPSPARGDLAALGLWVALLGFALLPLGILLSLREEGLAREFGRARLKHRDAGPVLGGAVVCILAGLSVAARLGPERYLFSVPGASAPPSTGAQALAFVVNGCALQAVALVLAWDRSVVRQRLATLLRWLIPSHFLGAVLALEVDDVGGLWPLWIALLPTLGVALCLVSVARQWKPFLYTGLTALAVAYVRLFERADGLASGGEAARVGILLGVLGAGLAIMALSWRLPIWLRARTLTSASRDRSGDHGGT